MEDHSQFLNVQELKIALRCDEMAKTYLLKKGEPEELDRINRHIKEDLKDELQWSTANRLAYRAFIEPVGALERSPDRSTDGNKNRKVTSTSTPKQKPGHSSDEELGNIRGRLHKPRAFTRTVGKTPKAKSYVDVAEDAFHLHQ